MPATPTHRTFLDELRDGARACELSNRRVLVALSGGADSVAVCLGLMRLREELGIEVVAAHLNHHLRGAESDADAEWVQVFGNSLGLAVVVRSIDVAARAAEVSETLEEAARRLRYGALIDIAFEHDCRAVVTGHNADDRVETILHHILRGTGLSGLRGMPQTRILARRDAGAASDLILARPLLEVPRLAIEEWLNSEQQTYRTDSSNTDSAFTRNRLRHELLPLLERDFNPQVRKALLTLATQAAEVSDWLTDTARQVAQTASLDCSSEILRLDATVLQSEPACVVREALRIAWQNMNWPMQGMGFRHWQQLAELIRHASGAVNLPGNIIARRRQRMLVLQPADPS